MINEEDSESGKLKTFKLGLFNLLLAFEENKFENEFFLMVVDLLEIITLHFFYINPPKTLVYKQNIPYNN